MRESISFYVAQAAMQSAVGSPSESVALIKTTIRDLGTDEIWLLPYLKLMLRDYEDEARRAEPFMERWARWTRLFRRRTREL